MPDFIDPPTTPNHRGVAHAVVPTALVLATAWKHSVAVRDALRETADELEARRHDFDSNYKIVMNATLEIACHVAAGMPTGFAAG